MQANHSVRRIVAVVVLALGGAVVLFVLRTSDDSGPPQDTEDRVAKAGYTDWVPDVRADRGFVGSDACRDCHAGNHASWHDSYHRTMTQTASPESVVPSFDDVILSGRGRTWELSRRGDEFWVRMADPDWEYAQYRRGVNLLAVTDPPIVERQIVLTTGSHNFQTYWVAGQPRGLLVQFPWFYSIADEQWIPAEDSFLRPDPGRTFVHWHLFCIRCHAVGGVPGFSENWPFFETKVAELGISCEACHGPAEKHVSLQNAALQSGQPVDPDADPIINPAGLPAMQASYVCGQCHCQDVPNTKMKSFLEAGLPFRAGDDLEELRHVLQSEDQVAGNPKDEFWNDGACRVGGDEFNGLADSSCFLRGSGESQLSCLSCHSMHDDSDPQYQLAEEMDSNRACTQCHDEAQFTDQIESHTHHPPGSSGSLCFNCHMPHSSFALLKGIRSHRVDSPVVFSTDLRGSRPNACNLCHLDETLDWTAQHLTDWYGTPAADLSDDDRTVAASLLWILKGDAMQRVIAAWHMGWEPAHEASGDSWQAPFLGQLLRDPYAAVRLVANTALKSLPGFTDFEYDAVDATVERSRVVSDVLSRWESAAPSQTGGEILIDQNGAIEMSTLKRLLGDRDDTHVFIPE